MTRLQHWTRTRKTAAAAAAAVAAAAMLVSVTGPTSQHRPARPPAPTTPATPASTPRSVNGAVPPTRQVTPAATPIQAQIDATLAGRENQASIAQTETVTVPAPATSAVYPPIPTADLANPDVYAKAFVDELLDTDYATQTRAGLLAWAESQAAPDTLPGVPAAAGDKALIASLAYAGIPDALPTPIPAASAWPPPASEQHQAVTNVTAAVNPSWAALIAQGWQPADPLATFIDLTGTLTVTGPNRPAATHLFSVTVMLGTALNHPGYGAAAVANWAETPR